MCIVVCKLCQQIIGAGPTVTGHINMVPQNRWAPEKDGFGHEKSQHGIDRAISKSEPRSYYRVVVDDKKVMMFDNQ